MITIKKTLHLPQTYPLTRIGCPEDLLFFDIETTGFSGDRDQLYLIGCTWYQDESWQLTQWLADSIAAEQELLHAFFTFLGRFRMLVHFNGDGFDLPFLSKRCRHYGLPYDFSGIESFDIYRRVRPYRRLLGLESMKQKAIEHFLGVQRSDRFSGGELIDVYHTWLHDHRPELEKLLLLHNEDDLKGMPGILPILSYPDLLEHSFLVETYETVRTPSAHQLRLTCASQYSVPVPFEAAHAPVHCSVSGSCLQLNIDLCDGTLKHFYPDYKNYYYLIYEDTAVHKSVGEYVDKNARVRATAETCYTKRSGCFVPQPGPLWEPVMKQERKDKLCYAALEDVHQEDTERMDIYVRQLIRYLM
ncbi:MAG: ribonuclease H-like domain-containing protein [Clostridiales bacterium]|nr:ribonuclease H-like domain-containing protein [Clostridiales bacterium]